MKHFVHASRVVSYALFTLIFCNNDLLGMKRKAPSPLTIGENQANDTDRRNMQRNAEAAFLVEINSADPNSDTLNKLLEDWLDSVYDARYDNNIDSPSLVYHCERSNSLLIYSKTRDTARTTILTHTICATIKSAAALSIDKAVTVLLDLGADPSIALIAAIEQDKTEVVKLILSEKPNAINCSPNRLRETPLILAAKRNNFELLSLLVDQHCSLIELGEAEVELRAVKQTLDDTLLELPTEVISQCILPFHAPVINTNTIATPAFRAIINARDKNGNTPLMYAAEHNNSDMVKYLLNHGASASIENRDRDTAANFTSNFELRQLLNRSE